MENTMYLILNRSKSLYSSKDPVEDTTFENKVKLLEKIDAYLRSKDNRVRQVSCSVTGSWQAIRIIGQMVLREVISDQWFDLTYQL